MTSESNTHEASTDVDGDVRGIEWSSEQVEIWWAIEERVLRLAKGAEVFLHMAEVAKAAGFKSLGDAISQATKAQEECASLRQKLAQAEEERDVMAEAVSLRRRMDEEEEARAAVLLIGSYETARQLRADARAVQAKVSVEDGSHFALLRLLAEAQRNFRHRTGWVPIERAEKAIVWAVNEAARAGAEDMRSRVAASIPVPHAGGDWALAYVDTVAKILSVPLPEEQS